MFPSSGGSLVDNDPAQARTLLLDAVTALDNAQKAGVSSSATAALRTQALGGLDAIDKVRHVNATVIADLGSTVDAPDVGGLTRGPPIENAAYVIEKSTKTVYRIDLGSGKVTPVLKGGTTVSSKKVGTPVKVMVKDQPVFLCCKSCRKKALADPDKTLAKVKQLKEKAAGSPRQ